MIEQPSMPPLQRPPTLSTEETSDHLRRRTVVKRGHLEVLMTNWPVVALLVGVVGVLALAVPTAQQLHKVCVLAAKFDCS